MKEKSQVVIKSRGTVYRKDTNREVGINLTGCIGTISDYNPDQSLVPVHVSGVIGEKPFEFVVKLRQGEFEIIEEKTS